jgi:ABC-2 type transport system ATP-binding protein
MGMPALSFAGVTKEFLLPAGKLKVRALDRFSFEVPAGEVLALLGPNGSGKSTAIKLALGLLQPSQGQVRVEGKPAELPEVRRHVGFVPDVGGVPLHLSGREALEWWGKMNDLGRDEQSQRIRDVLKQVNLDEPADRRVSEYSRGMKKRLALAQAILPRPRLLLLDEPFAGLDPMAIDRQIGLLTRLRGEGCTLLFSSHLLSRIEGLADRVVLIHRGKNIAAGPAEDVLGRPLQRERGWDDVYRERIMQAEAEAS